MTTRTIALLRFLLTVVLASLVLALLPSLLMAHEKAPPVQLSAPEIPVIPTRTITAPAVFTSTPELLGKLHPTLLKQWLNGTSEQIPVLIQLRAQADLNRSTIAYAPSVVERRLALVNELQATADRSQAGVLALLDEAKRLSPAGLELLVNKDNFRAIRFYEKHGFVYAGEDKNPVSGRPVNRMSWRA